MLRSRSSGLLPITTSAAFPRHGSHSALSFYVRRRAGGAALMQRILTYLVLAMLLAGSVYGVARVGRSGGGGAAASVDSFALSDSLLDGARAGGGGAEPANGARGMAQRHQRHGSQRHRQQALQGHLHDDVHDRRAALEQQQRQHAALHQQGARGAQGQQGQGQQGEEAQAAGGGAQELSQEQLEEQHLQQLQRLEQEHAVAQQEALEEQQAHDHSLAQQQGGADSGEDPVVETHVAAHIAAQQALPRREGPSLYSANLSAVDIHGQVMHTADLLGKVTLIVNVASKCGYTESNYVGLDRMYERYKGYGLELLAFPCNQFGDQEPGTHAEIEAFVAEQYRAQFPLMSKVEVNGASAHPIFAWLKQKGPAVPGHQQGEDVAWNFEKWLVDKYGHPVKRYSSDMDYHDLELDVYNELIRF